MTKSPKPNEVPLHLEVFSILQGGIDSLGLNDYGKPWPHPRRSELRTLVAGFDADLCLKAARETREIVQAQDRAPNITGLFAKRLGDLVSVRAVVGEVLGGRDERAPLGTSQRLGEGEMR